ncbi:uncharacterized protein si:dkey-27o4.1 [Colossoma macropomum]|uniref:uncharacterized protein si:dkey-27o4.1 n=1 Tax=Colossoma macropomum TaxID=42526 RepID=UPI0018642EE7|nr:uncharacterized protein si:dkey-27o4.1 [Colossoma macropomum]
MALSQLQCLDDNHINLRTNESKPEFFYSEEQRLALETLLEAGRKGFEEFLKTSSIRSFLSDLEVARLTGSVEAYRPGSPDASVHADGDPDEAHCSLQYWPDRSDTSLPQLDMGWPDCAAYRGVTRAHVYAQPPLEGDAHIKEVVRKTIAQAQRVIAIVMDMFTDVDIFKDLLDASFKRKVAVYILLEAPGVPHFLKMCERAAMHTGHLKNLRVRSIRGTEFFTRSSKKVCGSQSQKFMFVDGDKAVSGSYSFTWTSSRLDRNIITVLTGQAVDTFDKLFRDLYVTSNGVNLNKINLDDEPKPEPAPQTVPAPVPSAAMALKLINPKYALVSSSATAKSNRTPSERCMRKVASDKQMKEVPEAPQIHPGLLHLEKANMIEYLPIWPEPDPPSDVIGFINIRDYNKPLQAHLMRSELFEVSQAIRFKDPFHVTEEPLPEKAFPKPRLEFHNPLANEQPLMQPQTSPEENNRQAKPLDQMQLLSSSQKEESVFWTSSDKDEKDSLGMEKQTDSLPMQREEINTNCQCSAKNITASASSEQYKGHQISENPQLEPVTSACTESKYSSLASKTIHTSLAHTETTSVTQSTDQATEAMRTTAVQDNQRLKNKDKEPDTYETKGVDRHSAETPNCDSNFSSTSEEYFECSDSLAVDSRFEDIVNGMPTCSGLSEQDWHLDDSNNTVTHSLSSITLQLEQLALMANSCERESSNDSLKETEKPQPRSALQERRDRRVTGMTIHSEPEDTEAALVIEVDRLSEPVFKDDKEQIQEPDASSQLASESKPFANSLEANNDSCGEKPDRQSDELPLHKIEHTSYSVVNDALGFKPVEVDNVSKSELAENKLSKSVQRGKSAAPVVFVQTKTESQSIVFSDRVTEVPLLTLKPELHSGLNYTSNLTSAIEVNDVKHQKTVATVSAALQSESHAKRVHEENCNLPAWPADTKELMIAENFDLEQAVEVKGDHNSVPELKENAVEPAVDIKGKTEQSGQKTMTGLKLAKHSADAHSLILSGKDERVRQHTCTYREHRNRPEAKPKLEGDVRKLRRPSPKPIRTPQEARGGSTKASVTKLHSSNHPTRPVVATLGTQSYPHGKQLGQNRAGDALPTLPDKLSTRRTATTRSSQSQLGRSRTEPSPGRLSSSQKQPQAQLDRTRAIQSGQSNTRQRSTSTTEDSLSSSGTSHLRRSRSFKERITRPPLKQSENDPEY